ncbi:MAG: tol-pal system-associated acyl-CoA thioesterase [Lactobacillaceae bacterium]|jgi:acyl-CoA thioester hydrolase|nr:tol-pal system-associated acyl-CoA thioesterase [Lactobacillaceae bacterium]
MNKEVFKLPIRVYYEDTDAGGIVYYANYLKFAERARTEFLRWGGFEQAEDLSSEERYAFIVRKAEVEYLKPSKLDDLIEVSCEIEEIKGAGIVCKQDVICNGEVRVKIKVTAVYISLAKMRPMRVPEEMVKAFIGG